MVIIEVVETEQIVETGVNIVEETGVNIVETEVIVEVVMVVTVVDIREIVAVMELATIVVSQDMYKETALKRAQDHVIAVEKLVTLLKIVPRKDGMIENATTVARVDICPEIVPRKVLGVRDKNEVEVVVVAATDAERGTILPVTAQMVKRLHATTATNRVMLPGIVMNKVNCSLHKAQCLFSIYNTQLIELRCFLLLFLKQLRSWKLSFFFCLFD